MASVGLLTVDNWRGTVQATKPPVDLFTRPGVAGTGLVVGAATATPFPVETAYYGTLAECQTWRDTALGYVGTTQAVTDGIGEVWTDVAILDVVFAVNVAKALPGSATHVIAAQWTMAAEA